MRIRPDTNGFEGEASSKIKGALGGLAKTIAAGLSLTAGAVGAAGVIGVKTAAQLEQADIAFTTMLGSGQKAKAFLDDLKKFAAATPFEFPELQTAASSLISIGIDASKVIPILTSVGNATAGMGTGAEGVKRATVAIQQMNAAGRITAEDLNQLRDAGIPVFDLLASATGKTKEELAGMAQNGKLGRQELEQLMTALETGKGLERFNGLMQKQSASLAGMFSTLRDTVQMNLADAVQPFIPALKSVMDRGTPIIGQFLTDFSNAGKGFLSGFQVDPATVTTPLQGIEAAGFKAKLALTGIRDFITGNDFTGAFVQLGIPVDVVQSFEDFRTHFVNIFNNVKQIVQDTGPAIGFLLGGGVKVAWEAVKLLAPALDAVVGFLKDNQWVIWTLVGAYTALNVVVKAHAAFMAVEAAGGVLKYLKATKLVSGAMKIWTAVQWALNAAMSANPIVLIGIAIAALVAGLIYAYKHSQTFRDIVDGALRAVGDAANWMWNSVLKPVFAAIGTAFRAVGDAIGWVWNSVIKPAWDAISAAASWLWNSVLSPVFSAIGTAFKAIGDAIAWTWNTILQPIWNVIAEVAKVLGMILIIAVFGPIVVAWKVLAAAISWAWENVLKPAWDAVAAAAQWLWNNVLMPVFGWIKTGWDLLLQGISWAWENVLKPVWDAIAAAASWLWDTVLSFVFGAIKFYWNALLTGMQWAWENVLKPTWEAIKTAAGWLWDNVLKPIFDAIKAGWAALADGMAWVWNNVLSPVFDWFGRVLGTLKDSFTTAVDWISRTWQSLKDALMAPVQYVIDFVWNDGLRKLWNSINDLWGGADLGAFVLNAPVAVRGGAMKAFANGGVLPGYSPGRDIHQFYSPTGGRLNLSGGEAILRPEFTRAVGVDGIAELNRIARTSGSQGVREALAGNQSFANGGVISLPGWLDSILGVMPFGGTVKDIIGRINGGNGQGGGHWGQMIGGFVSKTASNIWDKAKSLFGTSASPIGGVGGGAEQWRGVVAQVVAMLGLRPAAIDGILRLIQAESGGNPQAINLWDSNAMAGHPSQGLMQTIPTTFAAYAGPFVGRGITDPLANIYAGASYAVRNYGAAMLEAGGRHTAGGGYLGYSTGGVVPTLFDNGGILGHGQLGVNLSGKAERVLSPDQTAAYDSFLKNGAASGDVHVHVTVDPSKSSARDQVDELAFQMRKLKRGGLFV